MDVLFSKGRNGSLTCSKDNIYLHSSFNPEKEAQRFVDSVNYNGKPDFIVITGPCLHYSSSFLKTKFPGTTLIAVQYSSCFTDYSSCWDYCLTAEYTSQINLVSDRIFSIIGEEKLFSTLFISWKPSEKAWSDLSISLWTSFKSLLEKAESVLSTRNYFNRRWFFNTLRFFSASKEIVIPESLHKPIVITASGPSLKNSFAFLKKYRNTFILMAASSSLEPLLAEGIIPDFCISTDGGWWAKKHLEVLVRNSLNIPLLISPESAVPSCLLTDNQIIPLSYSDFPDSSFYSALKLPFIKAERNGTVSGTAASIALEMTDGPVYFCGLDLAVSNGFQHTMPNALENLNSQGYYRLKNLEARCASASVSQNASLNIYRNWFSSRPASFYSRVFRLVTRKDNLEAIGPMKDIYIDSTIPDCFLTASESSLSFKQYKVMSQEKCHIVLHTLLTSVLKSIQTDPYGPDNADWYKLAALKEVIQNRRKSENNVSQEIISKTQIFLEDAEAFLFSLQNAQ